MSTPVKKAPAKKAPAAHPKYDVMIAAAVTALANRAGSSKVAISKYITANYKVGDNNDRLLKAALLRGLKGGALVKKSGLGCAGSFKLAKAAPKVAVKKPAAKKAVAPKKKPAAAAKKAAKASPKKPKKAAAKKTATPKKKAAPKKKATPKKAAHKKKVAPKKKATPKKAKK